MLTGALEHFPRLLNNYQNFILEINRYNTKTAKSRHRGCFRQNKLCEIVFDMDLHFVIRLFEPDLQCVKKLLGRMLYKTGKKNWKKTAFSSVSVRFRIIQSKTERHISDYTIRKLLSTPNHASQVRLHGALNATFLDYIIRNTYRCSLGSIIWNIPVQN